MSRSCVNDAMNAFENSVSAAFDESLLDDLERCKEMLTPNREGGGVGLGWVTILEIANECDASVEVVESDGVKSVTVRFDAEGRIAVRGGREEVRQFATTLAE